ncbi:MAG: PKD domain-containing protein, partial [Draconibacterium sp.]|nr:PKD domain-containing protein [Draconibacterium sp.]
MKNKSKILTILAIASILFSCSLEDSTPKVEACFEYSPKENIQVGDTIYFSNCSYASNAFKWSFGDGKTSNSVEPFHIYTSPGIYDVELIASGAGISSTTSQQVNVEADLAYVLNYGSYSDDKGTITAYNIYTDEAINGYYKTINGVDVISNVQHACHHKNNIYLMGNNADEIFFVDDKTFKQTRNAIKTDIIKPRFGVGNGDYLYVSCWGGDIWADESLSYIVKVNITTNQV